jgi:hypothetical protein
VNAPTIAALKLDSASEPEPSEGSK